MASSAQVVMKLAPIDFDLIREVLAEARDRANEEAKGITGKKRQDLRAKSMRCHELLQRLS